MRILITSPEAVPYVKTGGLGDVTGNLAIQLAQSGHEVVLALPYYKSIEFKPKKLKKAIYTLQVSMGDTELSCAVWEKKSDENLTVLFVENDFYFDRSPIYDDGTDAYDDNGARFAFFSKASLDLCIELKFQPNIALCNDWQTALIPYYIKSWGWNSDYFKKTASILVIHNLGYQGLTDSSYCKFIGLNWMQMREDEFEALGAINLLKGGIFYADEIITVSPSYANEILSEPGGHGLSRYLMRRKDDLQGIINGIDTTEWNPKTDQLIPQTYDSKNLQGKEDCKLELQKQFLLHTNKRVPVFGFVGRLAYQKGLDILRECIDEILSWNLQIVLLGSGDTELADFFYELPKRYPGKVGSYVGFNSELAHLIEAGSDFFLMPSYYEPCGLNQMYSMLYGTLPIVHATGGLNDSVQNFDPQKESGTGFQFDDMTPDALKNTIGWALDTWFNQKAHYKKMQKRAMNQDFSWERPIKEYIRVFNQAIDRNRSWSY